MNHCLYLYRATCAIILLNTVVYIVSALLSRNIIDIDFEILVDMGAIFGPATVIDSQWWRLGTAMFLHGGAIHLLMNMVSLYIVGRGAEQYLGTISYLVIYAFSGILGSLFSLYMHPDSVGVGASGAIFGIFGAMAGFFMANRGKIENRTKAFMKDFAIIIAINLLIGLSVPSVDISAHIGGLLTGLTGGYIISRYSGSIWVYSVVMVIAAVLFAMYLPTQYAHTFF